MKTLSNQKHIYDFSSFVVFSYVIISTFTLFSYLAYQYFNDINSIKYIIMKTNITDLYVMTNIFLAFLLFISHLFFCNDYHRFQELTKNLFYKINNSKISKPEKRELKKMLYHEYEYVIDQNQKVNIYKLPTYMKIKSLL